MIICKACSYKNPDSASFCESCGSFLEWTGEKVSVEAPSDEVASDVVEPDDTEVGSRLAASYLASQKEKAAKLSGPLVEPVTAPNVEPMVSTPSAVESVFAPPLVQPEAPAVEPTREPAAEVISAAMPLSPSGTVAETAALGKDERTGESKAVPAAAPIEEAAAVAVVDSGAAAGGEATVEPASDLPKAFVVEPAATSVSETAAEHKQEGVKHSLRRSRIFASDHVANPSVNIPSAPIEPPKSASDAQTSPIAAASTESSKVETVSPAAAMTTEAPEAAPAESAPTPGPESGISNLPPASAASGAASPTKSASQFGGGMRPGMRGGLSANAEKAKPEVVPPAVSPTPEASTPESAPAGPDLFDALETEPTEPAIGQRPTAIAPSALKPQMSRRRATRSEAAHVTAVREERIDESVPSIICPNCSAGNDPARYFCHHCAQVLPEPPPPPPPLTRWQKVKLWFRKKYEKIFYTKPAEAPAGERVGKMWRSAGVDSSNETVKGRLVGVARKSAMAVGGLALLFAYLGPFRPQFNNAFSRIRSDVLNRIELRYNAVFPVSATASSYLPALPPTNAIDGLSTTYWAAQPSANDGVGQTLTVNFSPRTRLDKIGFIIGADDNPANYTTQPRPDKVKVTFSSGKSQVFTLVDSSAFQSFTIHHLNVASVTVTVESVYKSPIGHSVSIAEVLFYKLV